MGRNREKGPSTGTEVFKTYKQRGEWIELLFMTRAAKRGFTVSKPHGDSARYDVGIEMSGRFKRVQVKGTDSKKRNSYGCSLATDKLKTYTVKQIDYLVVDQFQLSQGRGMREGAADGGTAGAVATLAGVYDVSANAPAP